MNLRLRSAHFAGLALVVLTLSALAVKGQVFVPALQQAIDRAVTNRSEIAKALADVPSEQREGLQFLIENMPVSDLQTLSSEFLRENVTLAYEAFAKVPWRERISKEIFLNEILPYASLTEARDPWRKKLRDLSAPLVVDCKTPGEAAQLLNRKLFKLVNVRYSTDRKKPDQSPFESMESGIATCSGLSILLVDACRSVGVPARVVGTPLWTNMRGNHTWVEVWDEGWHFTGAAEPDPKGLDRGWFVHDASEAKRAIPQHAIYATSFRKTEVPFPMVWASNLTSVSAVNVTDRYAVKAQPIEAGKTRLLVKVLDQPAGQRVAAKVVVTDTSNSARLAGTSKGESADLNDLLPFELPQGHSYSVAVEHAGHTVRRDFRAGTNSQELLILALNDKPALLTPSMFCYVRPVITHPLKSDQQTNLKKALGDFFTASTNQQESWKFPAEFEKLLRENEPAVREAAWDAFRSAPIHASLKEDFDAKQVRFEKYLSRYTVKTVGSRPTNGWAMFIAMHGGGGAPKELNDSQWEHMKIYYKDHPEAGGYAYVALRAPNDTWNGFYDVYVYPLIANLIEEFLLFGDVDPNKIFIMGYSHGGYGAFAIGPKMPDRFAAVHASAAAPTDGETTPKTLRSVAFTYMVGEKDTAYGRIERCRKFNEAILKLRGDDTNSYPAAMSEIAGNGHTGLPDRDKIKEMYSHVRNPVPTALTWFMTDKVIKDFYWLHSPSPSKKQEINAVCRDNIVTVTTSTNVTAVSVLLDRRLVDFDRPITLEVNGKSTKHQVQPSLRTLCQTLLRRGDPDLAFTAELPLDIPPKQE